MKNTLRSNHFNFLYRRSLSAIVNRDNIMKITFLLLLAAGLITPALAQSPSEKPASSEAQKANIKRVDVEEFDRLRAFKTNTVLDVRTESEFKACHIPGALNLNVNAPDFDQKVSQLDKSKTYLVHCAAGVRSARACKKMETIGFTNLYDLAPGFKAWEKDGKPVEK